MLYVNLLFPYAIVFFMYGKGPTCTHVGPQLHYNPLYHRIILLLYLVIWCLFSDEKTFKATASADNNCFGRW